MTSSSTPRYRGIFPVVPTTFTDTGELDLASQKRAVDFMIDAGSDGLCILANFSEQFAITDDERDVLAAQALTQHERVLRADGHDQAEGHQQAVAIALPHGHVSRMGGAMAGESEVSRCIRKTNHADAS